MQVDQMRNRTWHYENTEIEGTNKKFEMKLKQDKLSSKWRYECGLVKADQI